jgi:hypothetical protein
VWVVGAINAFLLQVSGVATAPAVQVWDNGWAAGSLLYETILSVTATPRDKDRVVQEDLCLRAPVGHDMAIGFTGAAPGVIQHLWAAAWQTPDIY